MEVSGIAERQNGMKIVLYGATGNSGSRILTELLARGHEVVAVSRDPSKLASQAGVIVRRDDLTEVANTTEILRGADAVVSAYVPPQDDTDAVLGVTRRQIEAVRTAWVDRLLIVGGAGGLEVAPGVSLIDSGHGPEAWLPIARSHVKALEILQASDID